MTHEDQRDPAYVMGSPKTRPDVLRSGRNSSIRQPGSCSRSAGIATGMKVLDIGCGPGDVSLLAAGLVGPTGRVVGVDMNSAIVATGARACNSSRYDPCVVHCRRHPRNRPEAGVRRGRGSARAHVFGPTPPPRCGRRSAWFAAAGRRIARDEHGLGCDLGTEFTAPSAPRSFGRRDLRARRSGASYGHEVASRFPRRRS